MAPRDSAPLGRNHPLYQRIFDVKNARFLSEQELVDRLAASDFVLLGERHDNPDHHRLQARLLRGLIARGRRPAVAFEIFDLADGPALSRHLRSRPHDAYGIAEAVNWRKKGWPPWKMYYPIVKAAVDAGLPVLPANLSRKRVHELSSAAAKASLANAEEASAQTMELLGITEAGRKIIELGLDDPIDEATERKMTKAIRDTHCGHAPERMVKPMIFSQRARDAQMAAAMVAGAGVADGGATGVGAEARGAVLIAGFGHVRSDRAVPAYLKKLRPDASVASLAFIEVMQGTLTPRAHARAVGESSLPFDYVWFTGRMDSEDPCEVFRKVLEKMRRGHGEAETG